VTEVTINRIERGHHEPRVTTARRLAQALGVSPAKLTDYPPEEQLSAAA
jgi:transcriptional regulator with XRE-family HTH domain